jgi:hypothetical protein
MRTSLRMLAKAVSGAGSFMRQHHVAIRATFAGQKYPRVRTDKHTKVLVGKPGDIHASIVARHIQKHGGWWPIRAERGWVHKKTGRFLNRRQVDRLVGEGMGEVNALREMAGQSTCRDKDEHAFRVIRDSGVRNQ